MVEGPTTRELMALGDLSRYRAFAPGRPDLSGVRTVAGDYDRHQLAEAVDRSVITGDLIAHYQTKAAGLRAVYFCVNIGYSKRLARAFCNAGIPAMHLDGTSTSLERMMAARALANGEIKVLSNVSIMGEGFDLAAVAQADCNVECIGLIRPTQSLSLHLQQIGRGLRPKPDPCVILDHAGNIDRHGLPDDDRLWALEATKRKPARKAMVRTCPACLGVSPIASPVCVCCGLPFEKEGRKLPDHVDAALVEIDPEARRLKMWRENEAADTLEKLKALGAKRGYKPYWAVKYWQARLAARARKNRQEAGVVLPFKRK
jgi:DNA repair protein RadD